MNEDINITIFVPEQDGKKWLLFQEYYQPFSLMADAGVFLIKNGTASLDFDQYGALKTIRRSDVLYSHRHA